MHENYDRLLAVAWWVILFPNFFLLSSFYFRYLFIPPFSCQFKLDFIHFCIQDYLEQTEGLISLSAAAAVGC